MQELRMQILRERERKRELREVYERTRDRRSRYRKQMKLPLESGEQPETRHEESAYDEICHKHLDDGEETFV